MHILACQFVLARDLLKSLQVLISDADEGRLNAVVLH